MHKGERIIFETLPEVADDEGSIKFSCTFQFHLVSAYDTLPLFSTSSYVYTFSV